MPNDFVNNDNMLVHINSAAKKYSSQYYRNITIGILRLNYHIDAIHLFSEAF